MSSAFDAGRRAVLLVLLALLFASPAAARGLRVDPLDIVTAAGVRHFRVEIADTPATREHGLMFRTAMAANRGMLFDFKRVGPVAFWMRNTLIPLDMIFIGPDGRVAAIARNAVPHDETPIPSGAPVLAVLELRGGRADEIGLKIGDRVRHRIFSP